jgi:hypothetical protein
VAKRVHAPFFHFYSIGLIMPDAKIAAGIFGKQVQLAIMPSEANL